MVSVFHICNFALVGKPNYRCIYKNAFALCLGSDGGGNGPVQLTPDAFSAEQAEIFDGFHTQLLIR